MIETFSAPEIRDSLEVAAGIMESYFGSEDQVWFYNTFDEAPSRQWTHMVHDSIIAGYYEVDDYIPNLYTQARHLVDQILFLPSRRLIPGDILLVEIPDGT